jgi:hypothetical protein
MRLYWTSKPPSQVNQGWILWSKIDFNDFDPDSDQVAALLFITRKKEIKTIKNYRLISN